jgi:hypothetical protein
VCRVLLQPRRPELRHPCPVVHCTDRLGKLPTKPPACEKKRIGDEIEVEESERVGSGATEQDVWAVGRMILLGRQPCGGPGEGRDRGGGKMNGRGRKKVGVERRGRRTVCA